MSINPINNSLASIQAASLSAKNNDAKGTGANQTGVNQTGSGISNQLGSTVTDDSGIISSDSNLERLKNLPEIRDDVVAAAKEKLENGFYQSREAALQTAKTVLS